MKLFLCTFCAIFAWPFTMNLFMKSYLVNISLQKSIVFSSNPSSPVSDLYDMLDDETLEKKQDEAFDNAMKEILENIKNVSKQWY